ncbi:hypothetical protein M409DRAFT_20132 [Zasmidium cellare ATCC 36951]|uniref:Uncharacterized protein n=1 Tax=Zasmidium cellare ATCC 36951 TaxID=1080233 RepID=A0A6A6CQZ6_ZASCE|nr:uncharacterized protein M409DRAFT_20132 [Zasmidium cellare ATCC 36951]KAF2169717.1 hypothetical protein M409DRAFT_20132 [Zasmidium cellare ATCC 36951]
MSPCSVPVDFTKTIDLSNVKDKTALITGGASGIGAGIARALTEAGACVVIADINAEAGKQLREGLVGEGFKYVFCSISIDGAIVAGRCRAQFVHVDVTQWTSQVQAFKYALEHSPTKSIDIVIACAGISTGPMLQDAPFTTPDDSSEDPAAPKNQIAMINVNLIGAIYTSTLAIDYWRRNQQPTPDNTLLIVASNIAYFPPPGFRLRRLQMGCARFLEIPQRHARVLHTVQDESPRAASHAIAHDGGAAADLR